MKDARISCSLIAFAIVFCCASSVAADDLADLPEYIEAALPDWGVPGLAVAVVQDDEVIFAQGFGIRELGRPETIDEHTLFQIGSTSKAFAAATLGVLVDDGALQWNDPIIKYLPWFKLPDPWVAEHITVRDLLAHTSGLQDAAFPVLAPMSAREVAEKLAKLDNQLPFRQQHQYTNFGYGLAGLVVEAVSGMSWAEFLEERILEPLEMSRSGGTPYDYWSYDHVAPVFFGTAPAGSVGIDDALDRNVAMPHGWARDRSRRVLPWMSYDNMAAAGSVVSSVSDMAAWMRMHLNGGTIGESQVLSAETVAEVTAPHVRSDGYFLYLDEGYEFYGMGGTQGRFRGRELVSHGGGIFGFPSFVALLPEENIGIAVLMNGSLLTPYYPHHEVVAAVLDRLLDIESEDWHAKVVAASEAIDLRFNAHFENLEANRAKGAPADRPLQEFAGRYADELSGPLTVTVAGENLRLQFDGAGAFSGTLEHYQNNQFHLWFDGGDGGAWSNMMSQFESNDAGQIEYLNLGFLGRFQRIVD